MNAPNIIHDKNWIDVFTNLANGSIPESYPKLPERGAEPYNIWDIYNSEYGFATVSMNWVKILKSDIIKNGKCLEVMAGYGLLSYALETIGTNIIATDNNSWANGGMNGWLHCRHIDIEEIDAVDAVRKYGADSDFVIMSWPPYGDPIASNVLSTMRKVNPKCTLIYIGEDYGGMTADDEFFEMAYIIKDKDDCMIKINDLYQQFKGIHDQIMLIK